MSIERPRNLIEEGQRLARMRLVSANVQDRVEGIVIDRLVREAEEAETLMDEVERLKAALVELGERGPCPHPEGNVCEHGIQWDLDCCHRCMKAKIAKALLVLVEGGRR